MPVMPNNATGDTFVSCSNVVYDVVVADDDVVVADAKGAVLV